MARNPDISRRRMLTAAGAGIAGGIAGCTGGGGQQQTATETPTETAAQTTQPQTGGTETPTPTSRFPPANKNEVHFLTDYSNKAWQTIWEKKVVPKIEDRMQFPVNIEYVGFQGTGEQRLTTLLQAGNAPESFTGNIAQVGQMFLQGQIQSVNETVDYLAEQNGDVIVPQVVVNGKRYVVPHGVYTSTIHYRRDIFEQLNLDPPTTWEQYRKSAKAISEDKSVKANGVTVAAGKAGMSGSYFPVFFWTNGATIVRWKSDDREETEIWFPEDKAIETLEYLKQLAEYSPDPASVDWGSFLKFWAAGRIAQGYHLNGWGAGVAANAGVGKIAKNTGVVPIPKKKGVEPVGRSSVTVDGHPIIKPSDNAGGALKLLRWMYDGPERTARYYLTEPTRFIPAYNDVFEADTYQNAEMFKKFPNLLDLNLKCRDEMAPLAPTPQENPDAPETIYLDRFPITAEMMNQVIVAGRPPKPAVREARKRYEKRLQEGKEKAAKVFG